MALGEAAVAVTPVDLALEELSTGLDHLIKLVDDGGLDEVDTAGFVGFMQGWERVRKRLPVVDHRILADAERRDLPEVLTRVRWSAP